MRAARHPGVARLVVAALAAVTAACAAACAAAPTPGRTRTRPLGPAETGASFVSPARWDFHPPAPTSALAAVQLADGACVFTAEGGQRWSAAATRQAGSRLVCAGKAEASPAVAAEELTSAIRRADGSWIYVGESGVLFEAADALTPFTRAVPAPEALARVAGAGAAVLGTTMEGRLLRWEAARGWGPVATTPALGGARVFDVAVGEGGKALALAFPEALFASEDGGATWAATGAPRIGARLLGRTATGELGVQGLFESVVWRPGGAPAFARGTEKIHPPQAALEVEVGRAPSAAAVIAGRAALDGDRYYEVVRPDTEGEAWSLARGRIEGRLQIAPLPASEGCGSIRLGARGRHVVLVCVSTDGGEIAAAVRKSADQGATWSEPLKLVTPDTDQIGVAVSPEGAALLTGVCRASDAAGACKPTAPVVIRAGAPDAAAPDAGALDAGALDAGTLDAGASTLRAIAVAAPQLSGAALLPAFSLDGRSAYFLGHRGKDDRVNLFVSHDAGETFSPRALEVTAAVRVSRKPRADDDEEPSEGEPVDTLDVDDQSTLRPGDDGVLGMLMLRSRGDYVYVTADDDGRLLQIASPPVESTDDDSHPAMLVSGHGRRVLAVPLAVPETSTATLFESLDGGATWDRQSAPQALVREYFRGALVAVCALGGCIVGDTVTRLGWGGPGEAGAVDRPAEPAHEGVPSVLTPIVCDLSPAIRWSRLEGVSGPSAGIPGAHEAMRGRSVWSTLAVNRKTGAISTVSATLPESGEGEARVLTRQLLGPRPAGQHLATTIAPPQHEGYAAARVAVPVDAHGQVLPGASMRNVEVAWENYFEGASSHAKIPDAGPFERGDVTLGELKGGHGADGEPVVLTDVLHATLVSITSRGIFVRPHARTRGALELFLDGAGRVERDEVTPWPSTSPLGPTLDFRADAAAVGGNVFGLGLLRDDGDWAAASLARRAPGGAWIYSAESLQPPHAMGAPLAMHSSWAWSAKLPVALVGLVADPAHARAWAHVLGVRSDGTWSPVEAVPTLADLGERARGCAAAERAGTPRVHMPFSVDANRVLFPGQRHPVLVREPRAKNAVGVDEPTVLLTAGAVVQGTPASPCIAAWEALAVGKAPMGAVLPGDLAHAWLFRFSVDTARAAGKRADAAEALPTLEYRPMSCRYDPQARVPESVWSEPGTSRP